MNFASFFQQYLAKIPPFCLEYVLCIDHGWCISWTFFVIIFKSYIYIYIQNCALSCPKDINTKTGFGLTWIWYAWMLSLNCVFAIKINYCVRSINNTISRRSIGFLFLWCPEFKHCVYHRLIYSNVRDYHAGIWMYWTE